MWLWIPTVIFVILLACRIYYRGQSGVCRSTRRLDGKTAIVTGSSSGIGKETARDLAKRGARVILACRNVQKAQRVADDIINTTGNSNVVVKKVDTSDLSSVRNFAKEIIDTEKALHILVNNAGILGPDKKEFTKDGLELTMATNHFGHFLLTNMLLGLLKSSAPSRVVTVSSLAHKWVKSDLDDINYERQAYDGSLNVYAQTKLCNVLFTVELADRLRGTGVTANCAHPGVVTTQIASNKKDRFNIRKILFHPLIYIFKGEELGAQTTNFLAVAEDVEHVSGEYFVDCQIAATSLIAKDRAVARKLWDESERLVNLTSEDLEYKGNTENQEDIEQ
ncbi:hypothetical protein SK128_025587 [Halocaridina rubra]|uniref:Retinol dehydrogenase 13 n=1 Tax=Halocaridina rubra TaxID=373956 RepID=A0AAN9AEQ1_HALRR